LNKAAELQRHNANVINAIIIWRIEKSKMGPYWEMKGYSFEDKLVYPRPIMIHDMNPNMKKAISPLVFKVSHSKKAVMS
jgi:hypothetical protein